MKAFAVIFSLLSLSLAANAQSSCLGLALVHIKVSSPLQSDNSATTCSVSVDNTIYWNESIICPLNMAGGESIQLPRRNGKCDYKNEEISGVLVRSQDNSITLEK